MSSFKEQKTFFVHLAANEPARQVGADVCNTLLREVVTKNQIFPGSSQKIELAHIIVLGRLIGKTNQDIVC